MEGVNVVIHMAAATDAANSAGRADEVRKVNFEGTQKVARACAAVGAKLVFFSTTSVYGTAKDVVDENCTEDELKPQSPYASSKIEAERMLAKMGQEEGLKFVICRLGTIFGASVGMRFHTAVNKFIWQAVMGLPITVWRTALHQKRPYLDLEDCVRAVRFLIQKEQFDNRVYNVLTINATVNDIVNAIRKYAPGLKTNFVDEAIMNQLSYEVANERFKALGFKFTGNLDRAVSDTVALLKNAQRQPVSV
jgi:nucleoside-diphosphate-sugar epimerase